MTVMTACPCGSPFDADDIFCAKCGRLRSSFFSHAAPPAPGPVSNATRYLCAAAYLEPLFATTVLGELMGSHRAVVQSHGIDLVPIVRHCYKARKQRLVRDILLTIPYFPLLWGLLVPALGVTFLLSLLPGTRWDRRSRGFRIYGRVIGIGAVVLMLGYMAAAVILFVVAATVSIEQQSPSSLPVGLWTIAIGWLASLILYAAILLGYGVAQHRTLGTWLVPGAPPLPPAAESARVQARLAEIYVAQHGNLTLYSGEDPFLGTGVTPLGWRTADSRVGAGEQAWSIATELSRKEREGGEEQKDGILGSFPRGSRRGRASINPVKLHETLRERLLELGDPGLPPNERVGSLTVDHHVVGEGRLRWNSPLVDPVRLAPYSQVAPEAITALIRHPQARLRSYLRVSISDEGPMVFADDQPVIGSVDQDVVVSAFVYVAVEGRMFYLQFVPTSLAPVDESFRVVDRMPRPGSGEFLAMAVGDTVRTAFFDIINAPFNICRTLRQMRTEYRAADTRMPAGRPDAHTDIGARLSVRELGAQPHPRTYIQQLDVSKYTQILERLVLEAVLDFLDSEGVDTTAYRASAQAIYNSGVIVGGNVASSTLDVRNGG
ncbi:MAG TPA: zinc ribbon domain-containing protein [Trebonia sp.]